MAPQSIVAMQPATNESEATPPRSMPTTGKETDSASASLPDTLAALHVNPETGLTHGEVDTRRKEHGYNEVAEQKEHPVVKFLGKFWGLSAWMLELIVLLSLVLRHYSDLAVVGTLLVVNAVLGFAQERRAAGVMETLRRRLQVSARVCAARSGRSCPPENWSPATSSACARRHYPSRREAPDRNLERRSIGPHGGVEGCRQGSRRSALVGVNRAAGEKATAW